ncbi:AAA family ATPase [bacterium]|nr:AAA family ATPase [bacterium]
MVLGKFLPPHAGHVFLVEFARRWVDELTVVVGTLSREPIPGELRFRWMRELFPWSRVVHLTDENPQDPSEHPEFWEIWRASLARLLPSLPDFVFASEAYGEKLAEVLGATFVPVDLARAAVPVSGTAIRDDPLGHWRFLPRCVRPHYAKRVCVFGPESTGKSTLARKLAEHYGTLFVPEYARAHLEQRGGRIVAADVESIARGQIASEEALVPGSSGLVFCDTDVLMTCIWSEVLFGACPAWIREEARRRRYDLTLLLDVDVPWVGDPVRYLPRERAAFFERCERELRDHDRRFVRVLGSWEERFRIAREAIDALREERPE